MQSTDTLSIREVVIGNGGKPTDKKIKIAVATTLPLIISLPAMITELTLGSKAKPAVPAAKDIEILDPEYEDKNGDKRFSVFTVAESPLTGNRAIFYYDKLFKDILVLPNVAFFNLFGGNHTYKIHAHRIGSGTELTNTMAHQTIPTNEASSYHLPETNTNVANTSILLRMPGLIPEHLLRNNAIEEMITDKLNLVRNSVQPGVLIDLGKAAAIFKTVERIPLYLLAQSKLSEYALEYLGNTDPGTNNIYISLTF